MLHHALDVTLNLTTGRYYPFRKPDNDPLYINANSNHPPSTIRQIPTSIGARISGLSCDQVEFEKSSQLYNNALKSSGYNAKIHYVENQDQRKKTETDQETSSGLTHRSVKMFEQTSPNHFFA